MSLVNWMICFLTEKLSAPLQWCKNHKKCLYSFCKHLTKGDM